MVGYYYDTSIKMKLYLITIILKNTLNIYLQNGLKVIFISKSSYFDPKLKKNCINLDRGSLKHMLQN